MNIEEVCDAQTQGSETVLKRVTKRSKWFLVLLAASICGVPIAATGEVLQAEISFSATDFTSRSGSAAPVDPVVGSFSIRFDTAVGVPCLSPLAAGLTRNGLNISLGFPLVYAYDPENDWLWISGDRERPEDNLRACGVSAGSDNFSMRIGGIASGTPTFINFFYSQSGAVDNYFASSISGTVTTEAVSAEAQLEVLREAVTGIGPGSSLANKVAIAEAYFAVPDVVSACGVMDDFINHVRGLLRGSRITGELADQLIEDALSIKAAMECE